MSNLEYVRTDKNGTKIYADYTCPRCGGAGGADKWDLTGWTCYECGGSGRSHKPQLVKKYTPEYEAKLEEQRSKRAEKARAKRLDEFREHKVELVQAKGFNADGKAYLAIGNTYEIKDELREAGAKWNSSINGWIFLVNLEKYNTVELTAEECLNFNEEAGWISWKDYKELKDLVQSKIPKEDKPVSEYVGSIGDIINQIVTLEGVYSYDRKSFRGWGTESVRIYKFRDDNGNILVWNTTSWREVQEGMRIHLTGTIKEHSEYKGEKQTALTRCKMNYLEPLA